MASLDLKKRIEEIVYEVIDPHIGEKSTSKLQKEILEKINKELAVHFQPGVVATRLDPWGVDVWVGQYGRLEICFHTPK
jgi:hypothetical protein